MKSIANTIKNISPLTLKIYDRPYHIINLNLKIIVRNTINRCAITGLFSPELLQIIYS